MDFKHAMCPTFHYFIKVSCYCSKDVHVCRLVKTVFSPNQNFDNDDDMTGERGCYFKDGKRRIGRLLWPSSDSQLSMNLT